MSVSEYDSQYDSAFFYSGADLGCDDENAVRDIRKYSKTSSNQSPAKPLPPSTVLALSSQKSTTENVASTNLTQREIKVIDQISLDKIGTLLEHLVSKTEIRIDRLFDEWNKFEATVNDLYFPSHWVNVNIAFRNLTNALGPKLKLETEVEAQNMGKFLQKLKALNPIVPEFVEEQDQKLLTSIRSLSQDAINIKNKFMSSGQAFEQALKMLEETETAFKAYMHDLESGRTFYETQEKIRIQKNTEKESMIKQIDLRLQKDPGKNLCFECAYLGSLYYDSALNDFYDHTQKFQERTKAFKDARADLNVAFSEMEAQRKFFKHKYNYLYFLCFHKKRNTIARGSYFDGWYKLRYFKYLDMTLDDLKQLSPHNISLIDDSLLVEGTKLLSLPPPPISAGQTPSTALTLYDKTEVLL